MTGEAVPVLEQPLFFCRTAERCNLINLKKKS